MSDFFTLVEQNLEFKYNLYQSKYILQHQDKFIEYALLAHKRLKFYFPDANSTWFYRYYNLVPFTFGSLEYYEFYKNIKKVIRNYTNTNKPLWFQMWLNFHKQQEILERHSHNDSFCHGYISIDPKCTRTVFDNYTINNRAGLLYIGPSERFHHVEALESYNDTRITIGFDVLDVKNVQDSYSKHGSINVNVGLLPVD